MLEASVKPTKKLSREDPYGIRVVNVNMGSVELLKSKYYVLPCQLDYLVVQDLVYGVTSQQYELEHLITCT